MRKWVALLACLSLTAACGGAYKASPQASYAPMPAEEYAEAEKVEMLAMESGGAGWGGDADYYHDEAPPAPAAAAPDDGYQTRSTAKRKVTQTSGSYSGSGQKHQPQQNAQREGKGDEKSADLEAPMVVYTGFLKLRVKRLLEAVDAVTKITEEQGGYIESLTSRVIVVRVPAKDFDAVLALFTEIGELLERQVKALDVTEQFTDLGARLAVARDARERLLKLLEKVEDVEERLRILQEIKRLSEQIESIESTLATLKNLVDYFTITIELDPVLESSSTEVHRSPFPWVRDLAAHRTTIYDGKDEISVKLPPDFVFFDKDDEFRAQAADTTIVRAGVVDNEPRGDNGFWSDAVHHEMVGRAENLVEDGEAGKMAYRLYRSEDVQPRYYLVAVYVVEDDVYVAEVFYPTEEAFKTHHEDILGALETFEVNR